jgi:hypothetical protein
MSSKATKFKKNQKELDNFYQGIINTVYGSFAKSVGICIPKYRKDKFAFIRMFEKASLPFINDEKFIEKCCDAFGYNYEEIKNLPLCVIESDFNTLIMPYMTCEDGQILPLPLNQEGVYPNSYWNAKSIKVLDFSQQVK